MNRKQIEKALELTRSRQYSDVSPWKRHEKSDNFAISSRNLDGTFTATVDRHIAHEIYVLDHQDGFLTRHDANVWGMAVLFISCME